MCNIKGVDPEGLPQEQLPLITQRGCIWAQWKSFKCWHLPFESNSCWLWYHKYSLYLLWVRKEYLEYHCNTNYLYRVTINNSVANSIRSIHLAHKMHIWCYKKSICSFHIFKNLWSPQITIAMDTIWDPGYTGYLLWDYGIRLTLWYLWTFQLF